MKFQSLLLHSATIKTHKEKPAPGHRVWTEERVYGVYCTMLLSHEGEVVFGFVVHSKLAARWGFTTNKTIKKFNKAPVSDWVPIEGDRKDVGLQTSMIRCHGDTQRG